jgi:FKBP-type peptidyl-prolyl cis-trans isomerase 2
LAAKIRKKRIAKLIEITVYIDKNHDYTGKNVYFLKIKYTASTKNRKPIAWFQRNVSFLKTIIEKTIKTTNVMTS